MIRPIILWPDALLSKVCDPVQTFDTALADLAQDMLDTMYNAPGRGLAAPQIGVLDRIFVMDVTWKEGAPDPLVCVNPEIRWSGDTKVQSSEGCLSIPGVTANVTRPDTIELWWQDVQGAAHSARLDGFAALCAQHELDHLNGVVTFDRVDTAQRAALIDAYEGAVT